MNKILIVACCPKVIYLQSDSNLICRYPDIGSIYICFIWQNISYLENTGVLIKKIMFYQYWKIPFWSKTFAHLYDVYCLDMYTMHKPIYSILGCIMWMDKNLHIPPTPHPHPNPPTNSKVNGTNMGPTWVLLVSWAPCWPHEPCYQGRHMCLLEIVAVQSYNMYTFGLPCILIY